MKSTHNMFKSYYYACFCQPLNFFPSYSIVSFMFLILFLPKSNFTIYF
uniref:Uncharacterized protein n=1 Tax=Siphoviridae sp. cthh925 TaxID=2826425 RepID=A0A8S5NM30_9CAUD|nr:MAG TPA: hypothetical protein [Siphoviridae sp. cthh925]